MSKVLDRQDTYKGSVWEPWTQNLYVYVGNNPVNYVDPTGHCGDAVNEGISDYADGDIEETGRSCGPTMPPGPELEAYSRDQSYYYYQANKAEIVAARAKYQALEARAKQIHSAQPDRIAQNKSTTAVGVVRHPDGQIEFVVASSRNQLTGPQKAALNKSETAISGEGHAEVTILNWAKILGAKVEAIAASRPICQQCEMAMMNAGTAPLSSLKSNQRLEY